MIAIQITRACARKPGRSNRRRGLLSIASGGVIGVTQRYYHYAEEHCCTKSTGTRGVSRTTQATGGNARRLTFAYKILKASGKVRAARYCMALPRALRARIDAVAQTCASPLLRRSAVSFLYTVAAQVLARFRLIVAIVSGLRANGGIGMVSLHRTRKLRVDAITSAASGHKRLLLRDSSIFFAFSPKRAAHRLHAAARGCGGARYQARRKATLASASGIKPSR